MINVNDLKPGKTFKHDGSAYLVITKEHSKQGRGQANVKTKVKNLLSGSTTVITFTGGDKVEPAMVTKSKMAFVYIDGPNGMFMNNETFEQVGVPLENIEWQMNFLREGDEVLVTSYEEKILGIELAINLSVEVKEAEMAVKGNTASGSASKKAVLVTGYELNVPQFIEAGETIIVNTENGEYVSRG